MTTVHHAPIRANTAWVSLLRGDERLACDITTGSLGAVSPPAR
jgi:hypothetical protein